jgi:hypothetical protein
LQNLPYISLYPAYRGSIVLLIFLAVFITDCRLYAQGNPAPEKGTFVKFLNEEKTHYVKFNGYAQIWARYTNMNPGSKIDESILRNTADLSLRRLRMKMSIMPLNNFLFVVQAGTTNLTNLSNSENSFELLDAYGEYRPNKMINIGFGKSNWKGLSRFASGPSATLLYDVPLISIANVNRTDLTLRNYNIYAKGQLGRLDYRLIIAKPFIPSPGTPVQKISVFNNLAPKTNLSGYMKWEFFDKEANAGAVSAGSYLGKKKVLALGIGAEYQKDALWNLNKLDTVLNSMKMFSADLFFDTPLNKERGTAFSLYAAAFRHNYGPNYIRNFGVNNMANGVDSRSASFNGSGNSYPVVGTGNSFVLQAGYTLPYFDQRKKTTRLMPAAAMQYSRFDRLADPMITYDLGLSLLLKDHASKLVFNAQSRPVYTSQVTGLRVSERKMMYVLMYQINIE